MQNVKAEREVIYNYPMGYLAVLVTSLLMLIWAYYGGLERMVLQWQTTEEYGYGYMIPLLVGFFIWQQRDRLDRIEFNGSYLGIVLIILGAIMLALGELATLYVIVQYGFISALFGLILSVTGKRVFIKLLPALFLLIFMIPLPGFIYNNLSAELQLISSRIGVEVIRMFGISVYLEGNVIDLGVYKLQVVEACSGLRYLFPLAALSYMSAYIYKGSLWKKVVIFVSSAPITVFMNSFRIGVIGVLVDNWGIEMAEGFLHDFEGWIIFMACMVILVLEMWLLSKIGSDTRSLSESFEITLPDPIDGNTDRRFHKPFYAAFVLTLVVSVMPWLLSERKEVIPDRETFASFPVTIGEWKGKLGSLTTEVLDVLKVTDYIIIDYSRGSRENVNLYVAYYESQRKGASIHSPRSCIPGGGWQIKDHHVVDVDLEEKSFAVNRLLIQKGPYKQLVYYWFDQRGRYMTNEYLVKWNLFWDALTVNRTDGALVRVTTFVDEGEDIAEAELMLSDFIRSLEPNLSERIPD